MTILPPDSTVTPFSVFVMRCVNQTTLGWEYCGEYKRPVDDLEGMTAALSVSCASKKFITNDILHSLSRANGEWHESIQWYRDKIAALCESDSSPPGPTWLIRYVKNEPEPDDEGSEREERLERESREKASRAAKARALELDKEELPDNTFVERLVEWDPFYENKAIEFVRYDEEMYNFVKEGETTKNKLNKKRNRGEPCALASDWYNIHDQRLSENDRGVKMKGKRKRKDDTVTSEVV